MAKKPSDNQISQVMALMGSKGGKAGTGKAKARPSKLARKAALTRWKKKKADAGPRPTQPKEGKQASS